MVPRLSLPYLQPVKNLHCTAVRGDKMERKRCRVRGRHGGEGFGVKKSKDRVKTGYIVYLFWLSFYKAWVQCAMHKVHCAMCAAQTLPLMLGAKFFQHLLLRHQRASHQTPTLYPPLQMTAKTRWIKHLPHRSTSISCNFLSILRWSEGFELGKKSFVKHTLRSLSDWAGTLYVVLWFVTAVGFWRLWVGCLSLSACEAWVCFVLFWLPVWKASWLEQWIKSRAAIGCEEN